MLPFIRSQRHVADGSKRKAFCWSRIPFGTAICFDGTRVLFDRRHVPIHRKPAGGVWRAATPGVTLRYEQVTYFYTDSMPEHERVAAGLAALDFVGLPVSAVFQNRSAVA